MTLYLLKIRGTNKIPDYIQIRDEDFTLIAYFKFSNPDKALIRCELIGKKVLIMGLLEKLSYGKIAKLQV